MPPSGLITRKRSISSLTDINSSLHHFKLMHFGDVVFLQPEVAVIDDRAVFQLNFLILVYPLLYCLDSTLKDTLHTTSLHTF
jgi:hypothetical protein